MALQPTEPLRDPRTAQPPDLATALQQAQAEIARARRTLAALGALCDKASTEDAAGFPPLIAVADVRHILATSGVGQ